MPVRSLVAAWRRSSSACRRLRRRRRCRGSRPMSARRAAPPAMARSRRRWAASDHGLAWTLPSEATVLGDFDDASFESRRASSARFTRRGDAFVIETEEPTGSGGASTWSGSPGSGRCSSTCCRPSRGGRRRSTSPGTPSGRRWYDLYPDQVAPPGDGLHWTGPYKSWEARCAECHATGYSRNYDVRARQLRAATWPRSASGARPATGRARRMPPGRRRRTAFDAGRWPGRDGARADGRSRRARRRRRSSSAPAAIRGARRSSTAIPRRGRRITTATRWRCCATGSTRRTGRSRRRTTSSARSCRRRCTRAGVRCSDCHDPHALELRAEGNAVCTQCHSPAGNDRFPTLRKALYDDPAHTFHAAGIGGGGVQELPHAGAGLHGGGPAARPRVPGAAAGSRRGDRGAGRLHRAAMPTATRPGRRRRLRGVFPDSTHRGASFATAFAAARRDPAARGGRAGGAGGAGGAGRDRAGERARPAGAGGRSRGSRTGRRRSSPTPTRWCAGRRRRCSGRCRRGRGWSG